MSAHPLDPAIVRRWLDLSFPIGNARGLPAIPLPSTRSIALDLCLGFELGQAALKLKRPYCPEPGEVWIPSDDMSDFSIVLGKWIGYAQGNFYLQFGFLNVIETLADRALSYPEQLPRIAARLDSLSDSGMQDRIAAIFERHKKTSGEEAGIPTIFCDGFDAFNAERGRG
jgi:hypothetical protein